MKTILIIAGSDSSGGAGAQADVKTAEFFRLHSATAITALTAQNTTGVSAIWQISPEFLKEQMDMIAKDFDVSCVKIGMLFDENLIKITRDFIANLKVPIVIDPVCISKANSKLLSDKAINSLKSLLELASLATPNLHEANLLFNGDFSKLSCDLLVKQYNKNQTCDDMLFYKNGKKQAFSKPLLKTTNLHGTGCTLSTAIACNLALGLSLEEAIVISKDYVYEAILNAPNLGKGMGIIRHNLSKI